MTYGTGLVGPNRQISVPSMEEQLAREMTRMNTEKENHGREVEKICAESPELREL